jgi:hypothetical protein
MTDIILYAITSLIGLICGILVSKKKQTVQETILETVNVTANAQIKTSLEAVFHHFTALIIKSEPEEAERYTDILAQKIKHFTKVQSGLERIDKTFNNINDYGQQ